MDQKKLAFIRWLARFLFGDEVAFTLVSKRRLLELAYMANAKPVPSKVLMISILRLDGTDFKTAYEKYKEISGES